MDSISTSIDQELRRRMQSAVLVGANYYQFASGQDFEIDIVGSRMVLWGISGTGRIRSLGREFRLDAGVVIVLPWRHDIRYLADEYDPFLTGAAHLVPWHAHGTKIEPAAAHWAEDVLWASPHRRDVEWAGFSTPRRIDGPSARRLIRLGETAVDYFSEGEPDEIGMRAFGTLVGRAIAAVRQEPGPEDAFPPSLATMQDYARSQIDSKLTTDELARVASVSVSTAERQFSRFSGLTPQAWIRRERLSAAARLLRTTNRRIGEIALAVGFNDPLYFSRAFRKQYGTPPSRYSRRAPHL